MSRALLVALVCVMFIVGGRVLRSSAMDHYVATQKYEDVYELPPPTWLPAFSLGYDEALADILWMKALIYFGDEVVHRGPVAHVFDYADAILTLDPQFRAVYRWAGMAGMYRPVAVTNDEFRRAITFLERGVEQFPDDGDLAWDLGASLTFELAPLVDDVAEKERLRAEGVVHMQTAARLGAGPDWLVFTNATQLRRLGHIEQAIRHLEEMYSTVRDDETRRGIERELAALRSERYAEAFRRANDSLEADRLEDFPYVSSDLYLLLGPRLSTTTGMTDDPWGLGETTIGAVDAADEALDPVHNTAP